MHIFQRGLLVSLAWGILAITCLAIALRNNDKLWGKSSLLVFAASAAKVLLYDLSGAAPAAHRQCLGSGRYPVCGGVGCIAK